MPDSSKKPSTPQGLDARDLQAVTELLEALDGSGLTISGAVLLKYLGDTVSLASVQIEFSEEREQHIVRF